MATLAQMRAAVGLELGLAYNTAGDEQDLIDRRINEGVVDFMLQTGIKVASATLSLTADESDYTLDTAVLQIKTAFTTSSTRTFDLEHVSANSMLGYRVPGTENSSPARYYSLLGANLFQVYPTPSSSSDTITFYYVPRPTTLSSEGDSPTEIPTEFHQAPELYALWRLASYDDDASSGQGERYREAYEREIAKARKYLNLKSGRMPRARLGARRQVPSDPAVVIR